MGKSMASRDDSCNSTVPKGEELSLHIQHADPNFTKFDLSPPGLQHVAVQSPLLSLVGASTARSVKAYAKPVKVPEIIDRETELKPRQLSDYFERIELPSHLQNERRLGRLDSELLRAIVKGHITHIPFENLSLVFPLTPNTASTVA